MTGILQFLHALLQVVPHEYMDHKQLQEMIIHEGLVLDKQCGVETF